MVWLSAVTKYIIDKGWQEQAFIDAVGQSRSMTIVQSLAPFTLEFAERSPAFRAET